MPEGGVKAGSRPDTAAGSRSGGTPELVLVAATRGWCAGVERAVQIVERTLKRYGPPVYVRKQIVHNRHVVESLSSRGVIFVDDEREAPVGARIVFSAHGVSPAVHRQSAARRLQAVDAVCPLVTKVHREARRFVDQGYDVVLIGHAGHEEVEGTMGEVPAAITLVETTKDVDRLKVRDPGRVAWISQTTLAVDETAQIVARLTARFPDIVGPRTEDICYATTNRQRAVKELADRCDLVLVVGSANSSNSNRLVEASLSRGTPARLIDSSADVDDEWLEGVVVVGVTAGASAPEDLVQDLLSFFIARGTDRVEDLRVELERIHFALPAHLATVGAANAPSADER
jgi:4-hydroxy-3-methylbut-2-enyl diphosphate reductase